MCGTECRRGLVDHGGTMGRPDGPRSPRNGQANVRERKARMAGTAPRSLYDKIFDDHVVARQADGTCILYIDRHLVHEVTSPQAFEGLRLAKRKMRAPEKTLAVVDHNIATTPDRHQGIKDEESRIQVETMAR